MKKSNPWQIISAVLQALTALFTSLKLSHDNAHDTIIDEGTPQQ